MKGSKGEGKAELSGLSDQAQKLTAYRNAFKKEEWDVIAGTVLDMMARATPRKQTATEVGEAATDFSANTFLTNWSKISKQSAAMKQVLFGGTNPFINHSMTWLNYPAPSRTQRTPESFRNIQGNPWGLRDYKCM